MRERFTRYGATLRRIFGLVVLFFLLRIAVGAVLAAFDDDTAAWGIRATIFLAIAFVVAVGAVLVAQVWSRRAS